MSSREHDGLLARVRQIRRLVAISYRPVTTAANEPQREPPESLEARLTHLEQLLEGLQNSVHRESQRQSRRIAELEAQIQPAATNKALNEDAHDRGL